MSAVALPLVPGLTERVTKLLERVECRRVETPDALDAIFALRYHAYLREGAIQPKPEKRFSDDDDKADNVWIFGIYLQHELISSIRMHVATPRHPDIPAAHVFADILRPEIEAGKVIVDPTRFVADYYYARRFPELPYVTTRLVVMAGEYFNADYLLATVRAEHQAFYKRVFGGDVVCAPREYPNLGKPISMMMSPRAQVMDYINRRYPFFASTAFDRTALFGGEAGAERSAAA
jgi:hypothetical protein